MQSQFKFSDKDFDFIAKLVGNKTGIVLADHKRNMVYSRLTKRLREYKFKTFKEYCDLLNSEKGDAEIINFVNAITTNVTNFFREPHHFEHLKEEVFTPLAQNPPQGKRLRIWSAGCSLGMEAYSVAMTMCETIPNVQSWNAKILATDIDTNVLDAGSKGEYDMDRIEQIPSLYRKKYLVRPKRDAETFTVVDKLRNMVAFKKLNLLEDWPVRGPFDVIFCRNVVIYFDKDTQRVIFDKYADLLKPNGWLYIGHSENLFNVCDRFESLGKTIYRKIR